MSDKLDIFISWSGERSKLFAEVLHSWLPRVLQYVSPWMSSKDISKGAGWDGEIKNELKKAKVGIICLTTDNLSSPWLIFESGAIASKEIHEKTHVCTYLINLSPSEVPTPLGTFQHTDSTKEDTLNLLKVINECKGEGKLSEGILISTFNMWWSELDGAILKAKEFALPENLEQPKEEFSIEQKVNEILTRIREVDLKTDHPIFNAGYIYGGPNLKKISDIKDKAEFYNKLLENVEESGISPDECLDNPLA